MDLEGDLEKSTGIDPRNNPSRYGLGSPRLVPVDLGRQIDLSTTRGEWRWLDAPRSEMDTTSGGTGGLGLDM